MTKRDEEDAGLALVSGGFGALLGYGSAKQKIQNLEAQIRIKDQQITGLVEENRSKDYMIAQLQTEIKKLKEELQKKDNNSLKSIKKSLFG